MLHEIDVNQKEIVFVWGPGRAGIHGNEAADIAAKKRLLTRNLQSTSCPFQT